eukprot:CAMPEP_0175425530 /NCGR_PEP_ID=MMETSP0095-20121207/49345_1 /TAXON_ID=311494 /ORGANISM="Alexandrium monilatum, Strain CCMP3105" /LENGTH=81 /DNA_ID=CAMNT_0016724861 /DNA_START=107 /DNA_END=349 /DNA_ORIENTATION=-
MQLADHHCLQVVREHRARPTHLRGSSAVHDGHAAREVERRRGVPGPSHDLPPVGGLHVQHHLEACAGLPALRKEGPGGAAQ